MKPEEKARKEIDSLLEAAGWVIQDMENLNLKASRGVAVREFPLKAGFADYLLFVDAKAVGAVEAKPMGTTLSGVEDQTGGYITSSYKNLPKVSEPLPFAYESTGIETYFRDVRDPDPRSRKIFAFHKPETLNEWLKQDRTLRSHLKNMPPLLTDGLRDCQIEAITGLDKSFAEERPRALIQMASGGGKTFTAITALYRLIKFANAKRILFLVDRNNLARQTLREFRDYEPADDNRKFTDLYIVQRLKSNVLDASARVCITTIQRLYSMLKGEPDLDPELEELSIFDLTPADAKPKEVIYNPNIPIETFDFIITDECHRSIYNLWRQVLEYFDASLIGLTATPTKQTIGFFNQNLVSEYPHERAVADGVNVPYEVYRIKTELTEKGSSVESGFYVDVRDKRTRKVRWEQLEEDLQYTSTELDRSVVAPAQIRTVLRAFKEKLFTEIFPGRAEVPKTLVFAKDDSHAEDIVRIAREEFGKGNDFCKKITYRVTGEKPEDLIQSFRIMYNPRIAVTVDMISTGTDIRPLECLLFMRDVKSISYFEQMKGRGTRVVDDEEFLRVVNDARHKTHFVIVDAVGVCESEKSDTRSLERKKTVSFEKLLLSVALGARDEDTLCSLAGRLARLDREITDDDRKEIQKTSDGEVSLKQLINRLLDAVDADKTEEKAKEMFMTGAPSEEQKQKAAEELTEHACAPFNAPKLRNLLIDIKKKNEQIIDTVSQDAVIFSGYDEKAKEKARSLINSFKKFIEENKDELTALQIIYSKSYGQRHLTYEQIKQLADAVKKPPYHLTPAILWKAYEQLESSKVRGAGAQKLLTNMVSLVRFALGQNDVLEPFPEIVERRFNAWLNMQKESGVAFTPEQIEWLSMMKEHIATSASIFEEDLDSTPFHDKGGRIKAHNLFGENLNKILNELNKALAA